MWGFVEQNLCRDLVIQGLRRPVLSSDFLKNDYGGSKWFSCSQCFKKNSEPQQLESNLQIFRKKNWMKLHFGLLLSEKGLSLVVTHMLWFQTWWFLLTDVFQLAPNNTWYKKQQLLKDMQKWQCLYPSKENSLCNYYFKTAFPGMFDCVCSPCACFNNNFLAHSFVLFLFTPRYICIHRHTHV